MYEDMEDSCAHLDAILEDLNQTMRMSVQNKIGDAAPPWIGGPFTRKHRGRPHYGVSQITIFFEKMAILTVFYSHSEKQFLTDRERTRIHDLKKHVCVHLKDRKEAQLRVTQAVCEYLETNV